MNRARIWITGLGHSGTTLLWQVFEAMGLDVGADRDMNEWYPAARLNSDLLKAIYSKGHSWKTDPLNDVYRRPPSMALVEQLLAAETWDWPGVVKDPRWSATWRWWHLLAPRTLPRTLFILLRDTEQAALSWLKRSGTATDDRAFSAACVNVSQRRNTLLCTDIRAGIDTRVLWYPRDFMAVVENEKEAQHWASAAPGLIDPVALREAMTELFDPAMVGIYSREGNDVVRQAVPRAAG